jgi:hypothetical protein
MQYMTLELSGKNLDNRWVWNDHLPMDCQCTSFAIESPMSDGVSDTALGDLIPGKVRRVECIPDVM